MRRSSRATAVSAVMAGTVLLLAGCTTDSGGTVVRSGSSAPASTVTVSAAAGPSVSAPAGTTAPPVSTAPQVSTASPVSTTPQVSIAPPVSTAPRVSSGAFPTAPVSPAAAVLDTASTKWLITYCTTILPVTGLTALKSQISAASGDLTKIKGLFVESFQTSGRAMTATAAALDGRSAPALTAAGNDLPVLLSRIGTLGAELTRDETRLAAIDPVAQASALGAALATYGPDIDRISAVVGTDGGLKLPASALPEVGRIAACNKVINTG